MLKIRNRVSPTLMRFSKSELQSLYDSVDSFAEFAKLIGTSEKTAKKNANRVGIVVRKQGYQPREADISGSVCRTARELLGYTRNEFCEKSGIGKTTLIYFELGKTTPRKSTVDKILDAFRNIFDS